MARTATRRSGAAVPAFPLYSRQMRLPVPLLPLLPLIGLACSRDRSAEGGMPAPAPPRVEFLLSAGDSTYWVRGTAGGLRMRGSPMLLAHYGGRFFEVYVADDDRSYYDALFVGQRLY